MENEKSNKGRFLFRIILAFLVMALTFLAVEVVAHLKGWHYFQNHNLHIPQTSEIQGWFNMIYVGWLKIRADYIAPPIQFLSISCVALFTIQSADRMLQCLGCYWIKFKKIKPRIEGDPFKSDDLEGLGCNYPMVLVQIPMCNEREVSVSMLPDLCVLYDLLVTCIVFQLYQLVFSSIGYILAPFCLTESSLIVEYGMKL